MSETKLLLVFEKVSFKDEKNPFDSFSDFFSSLLSFLLKKLNIKPLYLNFKLYSEITLPKMPLMKEALSPVEYFFASSIASSTITFTGASFI